jgi:hypothetical protein
MLKSVRKRHFWNKKTRNYKKAALEKFVLWLECKDVENISIAKNKLRGLSPWANYTGRATAACRRLVSAFADRGCHVVSMTDL